MFTLFEANRFFKQMYRDMVKSITTKPDPKYKPKKSQSIKNKQRKKNKK